MANFTLKHFSNFVIQNFFQKYVFKNVTKVIKIASKKSKLHSKTLNSFAKDSNTRTSTVFFTVLNVFFVLLQAQEMAPAVIYIDNIDEIFTAKKKKGTIFYN